MGRKLRLPVLKGTASLEAQPAIHGNDQTTFLGDHDKFRGGNQAGVWLLPTHQGFEAGDGAVREADDWLVVHAEFAALERSPLFGLHAEASDCAGVHDCRQIVSASL